MEEEVVVRVGQLGMIGFFFLAVALFRCLRDRHCGLSRGGERGGNCHGQRTVWLP